MNDDEWEDVASEMYALEIEGYSNSTDETTPIHRADKLKVIGLETPNPILQIDGFIFKGKYENTAGTTAFLNADDDSPNRGNLDSLTEKKLVFSRCLLSKKEESGDFFTGNETQEAEPEEEESSEEEVEPESIEELQETIFISSESEPETEQS